ncbi:TIGR02611 family protein [Sinosporangium album]|uniref:TIGR02611 family protein n=1 Tax=Sinosporangium album TaxID=504805 RepID=A0A1G7SB74_9ACTN|nr:TIGR02611 family protein [Sinosporangium album]SDG20162.1 TIGR02611 family protein [Sinosporangium album]
MSISKGAHGPGRRDEVSGRNTQSDDGAALDAGSTAESADGVSPPGERPGQKPDREPARQGVTFTTGDVKDLKHEGVRRTGLHGWLDGIRATRTGRLTLKIAIGTIGAILVIGGLILVPFPGPGWLIVFAGLAVLATEFHWAHKLLDFGKRTLAAWTEWLKRQGWAVRILVVGVTLLAMGVIIWTAIKLSTGIDLLVEGRKLLFD